MRQTNFNNIYSSLIWRLTEATNISAEPSSSFPKIIESSPQKTRSISMATLYQTSANERYSNISIYDNLQGISSSAVGYLTTSPISYDQDSRMFALGTCMYVSCLHSLYICRHR